MYIASKEAVDRARNGQGPTLIEAYTYRLGNHTTSDDAKKYRQDAELKEWESKDPLIRLKAYMINKGLLDEEEDKTIWKNAMDLSEKNVAQAEGFPAPTIEDVFKYTYAKLPTELEEQLDHHRRESQGGGE
jgi:pyruvate dehydrogenase E1 component alpha subunit